MTLTKLFIYIGASYGGGIVFYVDGTGLHGLISATSDQDTGAEWGCYLTTIGGTSTAIGSGQANTNSIVNGCSEGVFAARICYDLVLNGYSDWFLPSKDELNQLYLQRSVVGGLSGYTYWSSTENSSQSAWGQYWPDGSQITIVKSNGLWVRAIRAFLQFTIKQLTFQKNIMQ